MKATTTIAKAAYTKFIELQLQEAIARCSFRQLTKADHIAMYVALKVYQDIMITLDGEAYNEAYIECIKSTQPMMDQINYYNALREQQLRNRAV